MITTENVFDALDRYYAREFEDELCDRTQSEHGLMYTNEESEDGDEWDMYATAYIHDDNILCVIKCVSTRTGQTFTKEDTYTYEEFCKCFNHILFDDFFSDACDLLWDNGIGLVWCFRLRTRI